MRMHTVSGVKIINGGSKRRIAKAQIIPDDGYANGGEPYNDDEMDYMDAVRGDLAGFMERWVVRNREAVKQIGEFAMRLSEDKRDDLKRMLADVVGDYVYTNSRQDYDPANYARPPMS